MVIDLNPNESARAIGPRAALELNVNFSNACGDELVRVCAENDKRSPPHMPVCDREYFMIGKFGNSTAVPNGMRLELEGPREISYRL